MKITTVMLGTVMVLAVFVVPQVCAPRFALMETKLV